MWAEVALKSSTNVHMGLTISIQCKFGRQQAIRLMAQQPERKEFELHSQECFSGAAKFREVFESLYSYARRIRVSHQTGFA